MRPLPGVGRWSTRYRACSSPTLHVVEADVEVEVAVADDAVVGDDGNAGVVRHADRLGHRRAVVRHDHQHVDAVGDQLLDVADLHRVVAVGGENEDARAELRGPLHEHVAIGLPARLLERVERQADEELLVVRGLRGAVPASERQANEDAQYERRHDQKNLCAHPASPRLYPNIDALRHQVFVHHRLRWQTDRARAAGVRRRWSSQSRPAADTLRRARPRHRSRRTSRRADRWRGRPRHSRASSAARSRARATRGRGC